MKTFSLVKATPGLLQVTELLKATLESAGAKDVNADDLMNAINKIAMKQAGALADPGIEVASVSPYNRAGTHVVNALNLMATGQSRAAMRALERAAHDPTVVDLKDGITAFNMQSLALAGIDPTESDNRDSETNDYPSSGDDQQPLDLMEMPPADAEADADPSADADADPAPAADADADAAPEAASVKDNFRSLAA